MQKMSANKLQQRTLAHNKNRSLWQIQPGNGSFFIYNYTRKSKSETKNIERIGRMSMISEQVHYLRSLAVDQTPEALYEVFGALNEAADTIESLSAKLADMERPAEDCGKELLTII